MAKKRQTIILNQIDVLRAGAKGVSIGKLADGKTVLIKDAIPGDVVDVQVTKKRKSYIEGKAIAYHKKSADRVEPACEHFGTCGGCKWQDMHYDAQLRYKQEEVLNNLIRIGGFANLSAELLPILGSEQAYWYRNKLEFTFSNARWLTLEEINSTDEFNDRNALGFHIPGQWSKVLDIHRCHLQRDPSNAIRIEAKRFAIENKLDFFDLYKQEGFLRTLMIRTSQNGQVMVLVQFFREEKENREAFLQNLHDKFPEITSLLYAINPKQNDSVYDLDIHVFAGEDHIVEQMEDLHFKIGPKSFYQTNPQQAYELYKLTRDFAGLTGKELVYDLYTGTGTIAQFVSKKARKVVGVESVAEAIYAAKAAAELNKITNCEFFCGDMKDVLNEDFIQQHGIPDVLITDPPRDGMHKKVVENILLMNPKKIVYVSCNSATQARDLELMKEQYKIIKVQPVDMFPQTHHVENIVLLERI
ncbi:23S rRNA (uracil(1939)-C(5))-methyltransferase RlmD [Weeksella virosa]|uniref:RNA methyltransferase, TrmA family n=1 Tax=Weeksella virosa (strain ATCC 43766 / DSM 16922 / JCM 21250 / CCUG 30538 / CDC 9751 / IAM 14551 / NBRC 16016 / NCTC 11634 / CL345/78) TaxID=865938 RepID=F0NYG3_WEEVC|nr:23S rRNA (uracil(1939)-C(5))-methyltransferase RlmD [Weeksella virosa]ADX67083.1 RNA methyltransferase, TrmA family [Weeksella virosa DSM 16922]MDK7675010.1 23S rRNA (uracil(1939)-C(5))-methyltransferase RlmD [Weeksella virosa]SUP53353.1 23S rRNA (uracil-C(5))-methyltransferase RlmCD [Weeksella virosa]VEH63182.1 23S rRNA (uracil-C(5))-methyltransferase RlmCD [Weeksella virosa]